MSGSEIDNLKRDKKNLTKLVNLTAEIISTLKQIHMYDQNSVASDYFGVEKLMKTFIIDHNQTIQQIALKENGIE